MSDIYCNLETITTHEMFTYKKSTFSLLARIIVLFFYIASNNFDGYYIFTYFTLNCEDDKSDLIHTDIPCFLPLNIVQQIPQSELDGYFYISEIVHDSLVHPSHTLFLTFQEPSMEAIRARQFSYHRITFQPKYFSTSLFSSHHH